MKVTTVSLLLGNGSTAIIFWKLAGTVSKLYRERYYYKMCDLALIKFILYAYKNYIGK